MNQATDNLFSALKLAAVLAAAALAAGCLSAKSPLTAKAAPAAEAVEAVEPAAPAPVVQLPTGPVKYWTVAAGDNLWNISAEEEVYNVPERWPLIYRANLEQINDADLIYPGQVLDIPRDSSITEIGAAVRHARTRGAWAVGPIESSDRAYLRNSN